jgi:hypothetical protein
MFSLFCG